MIKATDQISLARVSDGQDADKQYFFHDDAGAHVTTVPDNANSGSNLLMTSQGLKICNGTKNVAEFAKDRVSLLGGTESITMYSKGEGGLITSETEVGISVQGIGRIYFQEGFEAGDTNGVFITLDSGKEGFVPTIRFSVNQAAVEAGNEDVAVSLDYCGSSIYGRDVDLLASWWESVRDGWYCTQSPEGMLTMRKRVAVTFGNTWTAVGGHYRNVQTLTLPFDIPYEDRIEMSGMAAANGMLAFVNSDNHSIGLNKVELMAYKENSGNASYSVNMAITITAKTNVVLGDANTEEIVNNRLSEIENGSY